MKTSNNTVLITGGSAGIGLALAKALTLQGNKIIMAGRDADRLQAAQQQVPNASILQADIIRKDDIEKLITRLQADFPDLNMVINNAGRALVYNLAAEKVQASHKAADEMQTNYLSVIRLNELLLPLLQKQPEAAIVNVSSVVAFVPGSLATYSASKAALHSYTQSLRLALKGSSVKVFELMPPLVNTEFSAPIGGHKGIAPEQVASEFVKGWSSDAYEIRVGNTEDIYRLYLSSPAAAFNTMNGLN